MKSSQPKKYNIKTKRLNPRTITYWDLNNIFQGLSDYRVAQYYGVYLQTLEAVKEQMQWFVQKEQYWWAISRNKDGEFFGAVGFNGISNNRKSAELGIWLLPTFGYGLYARGAARGVFFRL